MTKLEFVLNAIRKECISEVSSADIELLELMSGEEYIADWEVRLEHLLRAIPLEGIVFPSKEIANLHFDGAFFSYDLTKSVEENLKGNEELLDFLTSILV